MTTFDPVCANRSVFFILLREPKVLAICHDGNELDDIRDAIHEAVITIVHPEIDLKSRRFVDWFAGLEDRNKATTVALLDQIIDRAALIRTALTSEGRCPKDITINEEVTNDT